MRVSLRVSVREGTDSVLYIQITHTLNAIIILEYVQPITIYVEVYIYMRWLLTMPARI